MSSPLDRYKRTKEFIQSNFKEKVDIEAIERISLYSYRNINRIFLSLHNETIGKYVKRIRLEKAAEYIKYSDRQISEIALEIGFSDVASFSKAFKKKFRFSPQAYRASAAEQEILNSQTIRADQNINPPEFAIEVLPAFHMLYLEHRGNYKDFNTIEKAWDTLLTYCEKMNLLSYNTIYFSETLDDIEISDEINARTNIAIILDKAPSFNPDELFQIKEHGPQKYAKFIHLGSPEILEDTYTQIYAFWLTDIRLEFADKPTLEFYVNHELDIPQEQYITEIYIPVE